MAALIYGLCALTAMICAWLLLYAHRQSGYRLLLWGGLCFVMLTLSNILLVADKLIFPDMDLTIYRTVCSLTGMTILLYGLIWDTE